MDQGTPTTADTTATCPWSGTAAPVRELGPSDVLALPRHRAMVVQYLPSESGARELHLFHDDKDISFDEADLFSFGEQLAKQARFVAGDAVSWGPNLNWDRIQPLLQHLVDDGVLGYANDAHRSDEANAREGARRSPLPPAPSSRVRWWNECEDITRELTGVAVEPAYLELIVPVFRIAHMALDGDDRQVGEANVFPPALRVETPTEWRTSNLPGTRYQVDRPMNVTAMKAMRAHWPRMMGALLKVRAAYLRRYPLAGKPWTVGEVERLATCVLAVPTYQAALWREGAPAERIDPALSSMFRVTDGLRMVMHQMMFVPIGEPTRSPDDIVTVETILDYAERNHSFHSAHGVCAGPQMMVREFLEILVDGDDRAGHGNVALGDAVDGALADLETALDYALLGLQAHAAIFMMWPAMARAYDRLAGIADTWKDDIGDAAARFRERMRAHRTTLAEASYLASEDWRTAREQVYVDMFSRSADGTGRNSGTEADIVALGGPSSRADEADAEACLDEAMRLALATSDGMALPGIGSARVAAMDFLRHLRAMLIVGTRAQARVSALLGRPAPSRHFDARQADSHYRLLGNGQRRLPFLIDELEDLLGLRIHVDPTQISIAADIDPSAMDFRSSDDIASIGTRALAHA